MKKSKSLCKEEWVSFHSTAACILYMSNMIRPRVKLACRFLCTKVVALNKEDEKKRIRLLNFPWETRKEKYLFGQGHGLNVLKFYTDGVFACHNDGKSHRGADC